MSFEETSFEELSIQDLDIEELESRLEMAAAAEWHFHVHVGGAPPGPMPPEPPWPPMR